MPITRSQKRMISTRITNAAPFLRMPVDSQNLYFHLILAADDDGVVEAYGVMKMLGSNEDNLRLLEAKQYIKVLNDDLVTAIIHWQEHNYVRPERLNPSIHRPLLLKMIPDFFVKEPKPRSDVMENKRLFADGCTTVRQTVDNRTAQYNVTKYNVIQSNTNPAFDAFWIQYPRKVGKFTCRRAWEKINPEGELLEKIMASLERHKKSTGWMKDQGRFIPHPTTWINQKRWEDEVELFVNKSITISP